MFGLPDQTLEELHEDIDHMLQAHPPHVSLYGPTYKEGTPLYKALNKGKVVAIDEDIWIEQFTSITSRLEDAGYMRYEVSNFAYHPIKPSTMREYGKTNTIWVWGSCEPMGFTNRCTYSLSKRLEGMDELLKTSK